MVKLLLTKPPVLVPPSDGESLLLYIAATMQVVSAALVVEREEEGHALKVQRPVYFSQRGTIRLQNPLLPNLEAPLHRPHHQEEAMPLLRVTPYGSHDVIPP